MVALLSLIGIYVQIIVGNGGWSLQFIIHFLMFYSATFYLKGVFQQSFVWDAKTKGRAVNPRT